MKEVRFDKSAGMFETWESGRLRCEQFGDRMTWKERVVLEWYKKLGNAQRTSAIRVGRL